ncbi:hypothetical protein [Streptomyces sp. WAC06614]|uniref:hypothetical protein n=1 Tax=Streptomyces sp. WAC06614 TaxID=2487416 RepID=UPI00163C2C08|nr:hypothetical protein [Streptomyces sp. WAC06614]
MRRLSLALGALAAAATLALAPAGQAQAAPAAAPAVTGGPFGCAYLMGPAVIPAHPYWCLGHPVTVLHPGQVRHAPFGHVLYVP